MENIVKFNYKNLYCRKWVVKMYIGLQNYSLIWHIEPELLPMSYQTWQFKNISEVWSVE